MELKNMEKLEKSIVALTIEISAQEIEAGKEKAFRKSGKNITVPGFRKGKATRKVIESLYGAGVFFEEGLNICYPDVFDVAVKEANVNPVGPADVQISDMNDDGSVVIVAKVPVEPEVTLGEYKGLSVLKEDATVSETEVTAELERMAQRNASVQSVEREAQNGDTAVIDFEGFVDGVAFAGGKGEGHDLKLGSGSFIPGFEEQLVGCKAGDEKDVEVTFPTEYHAEELAGKVAVFKCKVHEVKETVLPVMDDEFAKDVSETAETLEDLKKEIMDRLSSNKEAEVNNAYEEKLLDAVLENMQAEIPDAMYETQVNNLMQDFNYRMQMQGMNMEQYMQMTGSSEGALRTMFRPQAERQVKVRLALQKIVELENFEVSEADLDAKYSEMAEQYKMDIEKVKSAVPADAMMGDLKFEKAMDVIRG